MIPRAPLALRGLLLCLAVVAVAVGPAGARAPTATNPLSAIFYYPWYGTPELNGSYNHWADEGHVPPADLASRFYPERGPYSSTDPAVLRAQMREIAGAGIGEIVVSWWGWGSPEDRRLEVVIRAARRANLRVAAHLEPYAGRSAASVEADVAHLRTLGVTEFYVYRPLDISLADWVALNDRLTGVTLFAQTAQVGEAAAGHFDGVYTYDVLAYDGSTFRRLCNQAHVAGLLCAPSVGPGFDATRSTGDPRVRPRRGGATYDAMWTAAVASGADQVTITSYNEWMEGTQIEAARTQGRAFGFAYSTYEGSWGLRGRRAAGSYLARTAYWTRAFAVVSAAR